MGMGMDRAQSMLNLYQSNEMSELARVFCERRTAGQDPLIPRTVVVQSFGIGQWLKLQLAERDGIAAKDIPDELERKGWHLAWQAPEAKAAE